MESRRGLLIVVLTAVLPTWGCPGSLVVGDRPDDDTSAPGDDDTVDPGDDDTTAPADDDDSGDDDTTDPGDDDSEPLMATWDGSRTVYIDFSDHAEDYWGKVDCEAPYDQAGPNVTGVHQDLCPLCWHIFQVSHVPAPANEVEQCISQVYWETVAYERLYGIQMLDDTAFVLWRNFGNLDAPLEEYGSGVLEGDSFTWISDVSDYQWYTYWAEGAGTFGS